MGIELINKYFDNLTERQISQYEALYELYLDWNSKINIISRKDIENLYERHVLHSLAIAKVLRFKDGTSIIDVGTGGGFPAIPLAIMFPECKFTLIDSTNKKLRVADAVAQSIGLNNTKTHHARIEDVKTRHDFVVSRAAMDMLTLVQLTRKNVSSKHMNALPNGLICLKGGEIDSEIAPFKNRTTIYNLKDWFAEEFFETKKAIYMPL